MSGDGIRDGFSTHEDSRPIAVRRWMIDATRDDDGSANVTAALLLAQVTWWCEPSTRTGRQRASHKHGDQLWLLRSDSDWFEETGLSERQVRRARSRLAALGLIESKVFVDKGVRAVHLRRLPLADIDEQTAQAVVCSEGGKRPKRSDHLTVWAVSRARGSSLQEREVEEEVLAPAAHEVDPRKEVAHSLTTLAFEQPVKPVTTGGFLSVMARIRDQLDAGQEPDAIRRAILAGPITWTNNGLTVAISRASSRGAQTTIGQFDGMTFDEHGTLVVSG